MNVQDSQFKSILEKYKKMTVLGLSPDASKPSFRVPLFMQSKGYDVVGVNPKIDKIENFKIYTDLKSVPAEHRKFVDVFRRSESLPEVVDEAIAATGVEVLWIQLGLSHAEAEKKAESQGIRVISNRCLLIEYKKYFKS